MPELDERKRIIDYDTVNDPDENYYVLADNGTEGTGKVSIKGLGPADMISDQYSDSSTYKVGDLCIHNNKLYVCTVAINTPHAFNLSEWELDTLGNYVSQIKQSLSNLSYELITVSGSSTNFDRFEVYSNSQFVYINFQTKNATFNENDVLVNLPSSCRPTNTQMLLGWCYALDKAYMLQLKSNGDLCAYGKGTITGRIIGSVLACII